MNNRCQQFVASLSLFPPWALILANYCHKCLSRSDLIDITILHHFWNWVLNRTVLEAGGPNKKVSTIWFWKKYLHPLLCSQFCANTKLECNQLSYWMDSKIGRQVCFYHVCHLFFHHVYLLFFCSEVHKPQLFNRFHPHRSWFWKQILSKTCLNELIWELQTVHQCFHYFLLIYYRKQMWSEICLHKFCR